MTDFHIHGYIYYYYCDKFTTIDCEVLSLRTKFQIWGKHLLHSSTIISSKSIYAPMQKANTKVEL